MYLNKAFIIGNLTRDPELKALPSGSKVCTFSVATNRVFKDKEGKRQEVAEFHNIVVFGRIAETVAQYMKKGSQVLVEGRIQNRSWDKPDGTKAYRTEIVADAVQFGSRGSGTSTGGKGASGAKAEPTGASEAIEYPTEEINPDDIPF